MNGALQNPQSRRLRSFFIKDILEHGNSNANYVTSTRATSTRHAIQSPNQRITHSIRHILATQGERTDPCISGCCECPSTSYHGFSTSVTTPFYHRYLYSFYREQAAWQQSLTDGVTYVQHQDAFSQVKRRKARRPWTRAVFSNLQRKGLEKRFQVQKYLTKGDRHQLASMLGLSDNQVKVWFQNRRMKWRQEKQTGEEQKDEKSKTELRTTNDSSSSRRDTTIRE